ncbi:MAG: tetratricopeptide repeat protein, partial [Deltaproteobacteria bacterium]|nr:tetratricopeptide repeat protein [Deltaproteobacteria bacterium]
MRLQGLWVVALVLAHAGAGWAAGATVTPAVYERLSKAQDLIGAEKYSQAIDTLKDLEERYRLTPYERALVLQSHGFAQSGMGNYDAAIEYFKKAIAMKALPDAAVADARYNLGQLYFAGEKYDEAIAILTQWLGGVKNPTPHAFYMLGAASMQKKKYETALGYARKAAAGEDAREAYLQLLAALQYELKQYAGAAQTLERLVSRFPKKAYWLQLAAIYAELGEETKALGVMQIAHEQHLLTEGRELINLARLTFQQGVPYKAAQIVEKAMADGVLKRDLESLTLLANAWM